MGEGHGHGRDERDMRVKEWAVESLLFVGVILVFKQKLHLELRCH